MQGTVAVLQEDPQSTVRGLELAPRGPLSPGTEHNRVAAGQELETESRARHLRSLPAPGGPWGLPRPGTCEIVGPLVQNPLHASEPGSAHPPGGPGRADGVGAGPPAPGPLHGAPAGPKPPSGRTRRRDVAALRGRDGGRRVELGRRPARARTSPGRPRRRRPPTRDHHRRRRRPSFALPRPAVSSRAPARPPPRPPSFP